MEFNLDWVGSAHRREEFRLVFSVAPVARPWNKPLSGDSGYLRPGIYLVKTLHGVDLWVSVFSLLRVKHVACDNQLYQITKTVPLFSKVFRQLVNVHTVAKRERSAKSVSRHFMHHRSGELVLSVRQQVLLQTIHASQRPSVEQL